VFDLQMAAEQWPQGHFRGQLGDRDHIRLGRVRGVGQVDTAQAQLQGRQDRQLDVAVDSQLAAGGVTHRLGDLRLENIETNDPRQDHDGHDHHDDHSEDHICELFHVRSSW
jgi:hypothetical protein